MPEVHWSRRAKAKLKIIDPAVRDQLRENAATTLHHMPPVVFPDDEGFEGEIMWHRGIAHESLYQQDDDDGPQNYFLFYLPWCLHPGAPHLGAPDECLEILDIYSIADIACRMRAVQPGPVEQADKAVKDLAARAAGFSLPQAAPANDRMEPRHRMAPTRSRPQAVRCS